MMMAAWCIQNKYNKTGKNKMLMSYTITETIINGTGDYRIHHWYIIQ